MGRIAEIFATLEAAAKEHLEEHPDCDIVKADKVFLDDEKRASLLFLVDKGRKEEMLDWEDEIDLEMAIGTSGDPMNSGWPDTTSSSQKVATLGVCSAIKAAIEYTGTSVQLQSLIADVLGTLQHSSPQDLDLAQHLSVLQKPEAADLPKELTDLLRDAAKERGTTFVEPEPKEEDVDWLRRGYL